MLKDSKKGFIIREAYTLSHEGMIERLKHTGELDFSFMDSEWYALMQKYQTIDFEKAIIDKPKN